MLKVVSEYLLPLLGSNNVDVETLNPTSLYTVYKSDNLSKDISRFNSLGYELDLEISFNVYELSMIDPSCKNVCVFKKRKIESNEEYVVMTWISNPAFYSNPTLNVFYNSLKQCGFNGDKIVFTNDMDFPYRKKLDDLGFRVVDVDPEESEFVFIDRHKAWAKFLLKQNYKFAFLMDAKDVVFQTNPIDSIIKNNLYDKVVLVCEGKKHFECSWNIKDQNTYRNFVKTTFDYFSMAFNDKDFYDWEVLCGGTIMLSVNELKNFEFLFCDPNYDFHPNYKRAGFTDQALLNFKYHSYIEGYESFFDNKFFVVDPRISSVVATADLPYNPPPIFKDGKLFHPVLNEPYSIWHQWNRVDKFKNQIMETYYA